jgi:methionyl-tRNA formyltransferase
MAGDTTTAATVMRMDEGLDTGPVCLSVGLEIGPDTTAGELHDALAARGASLMLQALAGIEQSVLQCRPQPTDGVTYAAKIGKGETAIDFSHPAARVHNHIRGLSPAPGAWLEMTGAGGRRERVRVLRSALAPGSGTAGTVLDHALTVACGEGAVRLVTLQRAGKRPMPAEEFLRGWPVAPGTRLQAIPGAGVAH